MARPSASASTEPVFIPTSFRPRALPALSEAAGMQGQMQSPQVLAIKPGKLVMVVSVWRSSLKSLGIRESRRTDKVKALAVLPVEPRMLAQMRVIDLAWNGGRILRATFCGPGQIVKLEDVMAEVKVEMQGQTQGSLALQMDPSCTNLMSVLAVAAQAADTLEDKAAEAQPVKKTVAGRCRSDGGVLRKEKLYGL